MILIVILAFTIIGLLLAIPLLIICGKRTTATIQVEMTGSPGLTLFVTNDEWKVMRKYLSGWR